ncbi:hypothetical protein [Corynebacterium sp. A21]|uniref:hypothetical protein n=1 Tax=Corynebacterium sp. A21 TaxID=3457318 RepID=UPI003FD2CF6C
MLARTFIAAQGWFYWDDLTLQSKARLHPTPDPALLFADHDGHLMPAAWLVEWLLAHLAPLNWSAAVLTVALLQLTAAAAVAWASCILCPATFRVRQLVLPWSAVPLGIYLLSPLTLSATTWLAAAVNALPMHAALAMMLGHAILALRRRSIKSRSSAQSTGATTHLAAAVLWLIGGFLFNERALFLGPLVIFILLCFSLASGRLRPQLRGITQLVVILAVPTILWSVVYLVFIGDPRAVQPAPGPLPTAEVPAGDSTTLLELLSQGYGWALLPTAAGGPWQWDRWHPGPPFADPGPLTIIAGLLVLIGLLGWTTWQRPRLLFAWLPVLLYPLLPIGALAIARSGPGTSVEIILTLRHLSEVAVLAALTLAFLLAHRVRGHRTRTDRITTPRRMLVFGVLLLWLFSAAFSNLSYARVWADQPGRSYFANLRAELAERGEPILDQAVPLEVLLPVVNPHNLLSQLLPGATAAAVSEPVLVDRQGRLIDAALVTFRSTVPGTEPGCGVRVDAEGASLELDGPLLDRDWVLQFNYFAATAGVVGVALNGATVEVPVTAGLNQVFVTLPGGGAQLHLHPGEGLSGFCVGESQLGLLAAADQPAVDQTAVGQTAASISS